VLSADKIKALDLLSARGDDDINFRYVPEGVIISLDNKAYLVSKSGNVSECFGD